MKLTLAEPRFLKESITIISELVNEAKFKVTKQAIELVAMDPANVAMVIFKLLSSSFIEYDVPEETVVSVNLSNLKQVLRRAKPTDMVTLTLEGEKLNIILKGGSTTRTFSLPLLDVESREQRVPELTFPVMINLAPDRFNDAIEDVDIVGESVSLVADSERFVVAAEGDMSKAHIEILPSEETRIEATEKVRARYSIEYLKKMVAAGKLAPHLTIRFNKDYPLKLEYILVDRLSMSFILAPRVENE